MNRDDILRKIQKCLALAKSGVAAEAAAALRQAQALMREHGLSELEVSAAQALELPVPAGATVPTRHEARLAGVVADSFGCEVILQASSGFFGSHSTWLLIGCSPAVDVAQYTLQVLLRLMAKARKGHIKDKLRRCGPKSKTARADVFCQGWVQAVGHLVSRVERTDEQEAAVLAYMQLKHPGLEQFTPRARHVKHQQHAWADHAAGVRAGSDVQLHRGVGADAAPLMLGHEG